MAVLVQPGNKANGHDKEEKREKLKKLMSNADRT